eukprot:SAG22_NODE_588_length_8842_cov_33.853254_2_plen_109_part_00
MLSGSAVKLRVNQTLASQLLPTVAETTAGRYTGDDDDEEAPSLAARAAGMGSAADVAAAAGGGGEHAGGGGGEPADHGLCTIPKGSSARLAWLAGFPLMLPLTFTIRE